MRTSTGVCWSHQKNLAEGCRGWPWSGQLREDGVLNTIRAELRSWEKPRTMLEAAGDAVPDPEMFPGLERFHV